MIMNLDPTRVVISNHALTSILDCGACIHHRIFHVYITRYFQYMYHANLDAVLRKLMLFLVFGLRYFSH